MSRKVCLPAVIVLLAICIFNFGITNVRAQPELMQLRILENYLQNTFSNNKVILSRVHRMLRDAEPFSSPRHRARYRFQPSEDNPRQIMIRARQSMARLKVINGVLSRSDIPGRQMMFEQTQDSIERINTFSRRAIRAIRDNNYALYVTSAKAIQESVLALDESLEHIRDSINYSIYRSDQSKESL